MQSLLLAFLLVVPVKMPVSGHQLPATCCAGQFTVGTEALVTCNFNMDLGQSALMLVVTFISLESKEDTEIMRCAQTRLGDPECLVHGNYSYQLTSEHLKVTIPSVSQKHAGTYMCQAVPWSVPPLRCTLNVTDTLQTGGLINKTTDFQNQQKGITTLGKPEVPAADQPYDRTDGFIIALGAATFFSVLLSIVLTICIRRYKKRTEKLIMLLELTSVPRERSNGMPLNDTENDEKHEKTLLAAKNADSEIVRNTSLDKDLDIDCPLTPINTGSNQRWQFTGRASGESTRWSPCERPLMKDELQLSKPTAPLYPDLSQVKAETEILASDVTAERDDPVHTDRVHKYPHCSKSEHPTTPFLTSSKVTDPSHKSRDDPPASENASLLQTHSQESATVVDLSNRTAEVTINDGLYAQINENNIPEVEFPRNVNMRTRAVKNFLQSPQY